MLREIYGHRRLISSLARREIEMRFRGSVLGTGWYVLNNLVILAMYTFVFGSVFKVPWPAATRQAHPESTGFFAVTIFSGLIIYNLASECLVKAPSLIIANPNYVKKVVFPIEILPVVSACAALFNAFIAWLVLIVIACLFGIWPSPTSLFAPLAILPLVPALLGLSWFLASIGVYIRDVAQLVPLVTTVLLFLGPVFYPLSSVPEPIRTLCLFNPITLPIEQFRGMMFEGDLPNLPRLLLATTLAMGVAWLGYKWFSTTKRGFADVI